MKKQNLRVKTERGITLIALIITIIVLLILSGVTINLTLGENGIFKVAEQAARNYKEAEEKELGLLKDFENTLDKTVNDIRYNTLASVAKPGDYVKYDGGNGYTGLWQVLYNDSTYGLQIISADVVSFYSLGGSTGTEAKASYNGLVDNLNTESRKYINKKYATAGRCVGSNPLSPDDTVINTVTLQFVYNGTKDSGCKVADTNYENDYNAMKVATSQNATGIYNVEKYYWLASRHVYSYSSYADFYVRGVNTGGSVIIHDLLGINSSGASMPSYNPAGIRPVITLYSDIKTNDGDGSEGSAFELVAK